MKTPLYATPTQRCLVYDKRNGRVIHVHDFVGTDPKERISTSDMEKQALTYAGDDIEKAQMGTVEATGDLSAIDVAYRVDVSTGEVITKTIKERPGIDEDLGVDESSIDLKGIKSSVANGRTLGILALILAIVAIIINWLL